MARGKKWPSKWWFWGPFLAVNLYLFIGLFAPLSLCASGGPARRAILNFLYLPLRLVGDSFVDPIAEALDLFEENLAVYVGVLAASYELAAVVLGLMCYGLVALVYAILSGEGGEGRQGDGSR